MNNADWTWEDMRAAAKTIAEKGNYGGFCMGSDWARFLPFALSYGGSYASSDNTTALLDSPEVLEAASFVAGMFEEGSLVRPVDVSTGWCGEAIGLKAVAITTRRRLDGQHHERTPTRMLNGKLSKSLLVLSRKLT